MNPPALPAESAASGTMRHVDPDVHSAFVEFKSAGKTDFFPFAHSDFPCIDSMLPCASYLTLSHTTQRDRPNACQSSVYTANRSEPRIRRARSSTSSSAPRTSKPIPKPPSRPRPQRPPGRPQLRDCPLQHRRDMLPSLLRRRPPTMHPTHPTRPTRPTRHRIYRNTRHLPRSPRTATMMSSGQSTRT